MIPVSENLTVTRPAVADALDRRDPAAIAAIARQARGNGARFLDVNLGPARRDAAARLAFALDALRGEWDGGIWIDTVDAGLMEEAVRLWPHPVTLNGYAGGGAREGVLDVAGRHGLDVVVFLMDRSVPAATEERLALAAELVGRCAEKGIGPERILIDPVAAPMGWMDGQARNAGLFEVLRALPGLFGPEIRSVIGLSNLATRSAGVNRMRRAEELFLAAAAGAGLTHVLLDTSRRDLMGVVRAVEIFEGRLPYAADLFAEEEWEGR
jgi:5-methyltetrahydrofolate corrinoid/iron sulfur protein methyltransferase